jgi:hypothetical protein
MRRVGGDSERCPPGVVPPPPCHACDDAVEDYRILHVSVTKPRHREIENVTNFTAPERSLVTWVRTMRSRSVYEGVPPPRSPTTWTAPAAVKIRRSPVDQLLSPRA